MEKNTKLIIAAVGLGGLGYFLYKKGLFAKKTITEVAKDIKKDVVVVVDNVVTPPPPKNDIVVTKPLPEVRIPEPEPVYVPIWKQTEIYPVDVLYPQEGKLVKEVVTQDSFNPYLYDKPPVDERIVKIDYTSDKYSYGVDTEYAEKDLLNIKLNKLLYV